MRNYFGLTNGTTLAILALLIVFVIDIITPLGIAIGVLYLFCLYIICKKDRKTIIVFAITASFLTILKLILFHSSETTYMAYVNRGITLIVMWIIALLAIHHRSLIEKNNSERTTYIKQLEQMLFMTNHKIRQPVANCLGLINLIDFSNPSKEDIMKVYDHIKTSAIKLDNFSKELNTFLSEMARQHKTEKRL